MVSGPFAAGTEEGGRENSRRINRAALSPGGEIAFVVACVVAVEWAVVPVFGRNFWAGLAPVVAAFALMFASHRRRGETARELGFGLRWFSRAQTLLIVPTAAAVLLLRAAGSALGRGLPRARVEWEAAALAFAWLFLWGLLQQYALQAFINRRAQSLWGRGARSVLFTASVFALLHAPNLWLVLATFAGGLLWGYVYQRAPNLYALGLSHALMTWVLVASLPAPMLHGMRVGYGYFLR